MTGGLDSGAYKATVAETFDRAAARYDRMGVEFFTPMGRRLIELADPRPGERVLDVGCGRGAALFPAAERVGDAGRVLGIDIAPAMIEEARREAARQGRTTVTFQVMDGERPELPQGAFDLITGSYSVIFLPEAPAALARYAGLLADGGRTAFTSPVFTAGTFPFLPPVFTPLIPRSLLERLPPDWRPDALRRRFNSWLEDPDDLSRVMERAGYQDVVVIDESVQLTANSGEEWVDWSHTQGMRLLWTHLDDTDARRLRERLITALDEMRGDGQLVIPTPVRYVRARRR
ncbi:methyltransferase domain-containing protein [Spirillospora sp. NBC_00431]